MFILLTFCLFCHELALMPRHWAPGMTDPRILREVMMKVETLLMMLRLVKSSWVDGPMVGAPTPLKGWE